MIKINWLKDYRKEFQCPRCNKIGMYLNGHDKNRKRLFRCSDCSKSAKQSHSFNGNYFINILAGYGFACPNQDCHAKVGFSANA